VKVYEALALGFAREGTTDCFGLMGDANMHWINAVGQHGVRMYNARHEGAALGMADGWARTTHRPGVVTTTCGPGVTQLSTTMVVASRARTPIVAFCGETAVGHEEDTQYLNVERYAAAVECGFVRVSRSDLAFEAVQRAFYLARSQSMPVLVSAPEDLQVQEFDGADEYVPSTELIGLTSLAPSHAAICRAAALIRESKRVVVIVGEGARRAGVADLVLELQQLTGALVATTLRAKNWLSDETEFHAGISGLFATKAATELLKQADCVIAVGASLNRYTIGHGYLYPYAKFIHIDERPHLTMGNGALAHCYLQADVRPALEDLTSALQARPARQLGYHTADVRAALVGGSSDQEHFDIEPGVMDPRIAFRVLCDELSDDVGLVLGSGYQSTFGAFHLNRPHDHVLLNYGYFGAIGQGMIHGIGALVGNDFQPTVVIDGDASFMMYLAEFETACRYSMPLLVIVLNDQALGAEYHKSLLHGLDPELTFITTPDLGKVAASLGGRGKLVRTGEDLRTAVKEFVARPCPMIIDLRVSRNVLSIPFRRMHFSVDV
jgi:acetolactate synthase I/II/III large subunit